MAMSRLLAALSVLGLLACELGVEVDSRYRAVHLSPEIRLTVAEAPAAVLELLPANVRHLARDQVSGRIAMIDGGNRRVLIWDPATGQVLTFGRDGDGPGEFRRPLHIWASQGRFLVEDAQRGVLETFDPAGRGSGSVRMGMASGGGHGAMSSQGHFIVSDPTGSGHARVYLLGDEDAQPALVPKPVSMEGTRTRAAPDHPLLAGTELLRAGDELYPRSMDLVFLAGEGVFSIDQRRGLVAELDSAGVATAWAFLPDRLVEDRISLFEGFAAEGRVSPLTFFRQVASTSGGRVFLPLAGPQEEVLGWSLDRDGSSWRLAPVVLDGARFIPPVEAGVWLDDHSLLVGFGAGEGVGLLEVHEGR